jgi:hypothetical protein
VLACYLFLPAVFWNWPLPECSILPVRIILCAITGRAEGAAKPWQEDQMGLQADHRLIRFSSIKPFTHSGSTAVA